MKQISNRKANFLYRILDKYECGIMLTGSEVKSIRNGEVTMTDAFIYIKDNGAWIKNLKIAKYKFAHKYYNHEERDIKILLTKKQIQKISKSLLDKGVTCIPLSIFIKNNRLKITIGVAVGNKSWDKREIIKKRDIKRDTERLLS
jgi:SsrA-binding protein